MLTNQFSRRFMDERDRRTPLTTSLQNGGPKEVPLEAVKERVQCCLFTNGKENDEKCYRCNLKTMLRRLRRVEATMMTSPESLRLGLPKTKPVFKLPAVVSDNTSRNRRGSRPSTAASTRSAMSTTDTNRGGRLPSSRSSQSPHEMMSRQSPTPSQSQPSTQSHSPRSLRFLNPRPTSAAPQSLLYRPSSPILPRSPRRRSTSPTMKWNSSEAVLERAQILEAAKQSRRYPGSVNTIPLRRVYTNLR